MGLLSCIGWIKWNKERELYWKNYPVIFDGQTYFYKQATRHFFSIRDASSFAERVSNGESWPPEELSTHATNAVPRDRNAEETFVVDRLSLKLHSPDFRSFVDEWVFLTKRFRWNPTKLARRVSRRLEKERAVTRTVRTSRPAKPWYFDESRQLNRTWWLYVEWLHEVVPTSRQPLRTLSSPSHEKPLGTFRRISNSTRVLNTFVSSLKRARCSPRLSNLQKYSLPRSRGLYEFLSAAVNVAEFNNFWRIFLERLTLYIIKKITIVFWKKMKVVKFCNLKIVTYDN